MGRMGMKDEKTIVEPRASEWQAHAHRSRIVSQQQAACVVGKCCERGKPHSRSFGRNLAVERPQFTQLLARDCCRRGSQCPVVRQEFALK